MYLLQHRVSAHIDSLSEIPLAPAPSERASASDYQMLLMCRKCRFRLAVDRNVMSHEPSAKGQSAFAWRRRDPNEEQRCSSVFIEPMSWMLPLVESGDLQVRALS